MKPEKANMHKDCIKANKSSAPDYSKFIHKIIFTCQELFPCLNDHSQIVINFI